MTMHPTLSKSRPPMPSMVMALASLALCTLMAPAWSETAGRTVLGHAYVSGGVSLEEREALHAQRSAYPLWVVTAAQRSGALLADVQVVIRDAAGRTVFDGRLDGPWLFVDLPLGRYSVEASHQGSRQARTTTVHAGDHHQLFFYFDTGDTVNEASRSAIDQKAYDGRTAPAR